MWGTFLHQPITHPAASFACPSVVIEFAFPSVVIVFPLSPARESGSRCADRHVDNGAKIIRCAVGCQVAFSSPPLHLNVSIDNQVF